MARVFSLYGHTVAALLAQYQRIGVTPALPVQVLLTSQPGLAQLYGAPLGPCATLAAVVLLLASMRR